MTLLKVTLHSLYIRKNVSILFQEAAVGQKRKNVSILFQEAAVGQKLAVMQTQRELRFLSFASVEYEGNVYMTPQDFLESVTEEVPRRKYSV